MCSRLEEFTKLNTKMSNAIKQISTVISLGRKLCFPCSPLFDTAAALRQSAPMALPLLMAQGGRQAGRCWHCVHWPDVTAHILSGAKQLTAQPPQITLVPTGKPFLENSKNWGSKNTAHRRRASLHRAPQAPLKRVGSPIPMPKAPFEDTVPEEVFFCRARPLGTLCFSLGSGLRPRVPPVLQRCLVTVTKCHPGTPSPRMNHAVELAGGSHTFPRLTLRSGIMVRVFWNKASGSKPALSRPGLHNPDLNGISSWL